jgi:hypothetical protein
VAEAGSDSAGKSSGSGIYLLGLLLLAGGIGGIIYATRGNDTKPPEPTAKAPPPEQTQTPIKGPAPPPPPPIEETTEPSASASSAPVGTGKGPVGAGSGGGGVCSNCGKGKTSSALNAAIRGLQQSAQGCYNRALRTSAASGDITVAVQVGSSGQVCSASITNDTVGSNEISSCVLGRFQGASLPPPEEGCVIVSAPIHFKLAN